MKKVLLNEAESDANRGRSSGSGDIKSPTLEASHVICPTDIAPDATTGSRERLLLAAERLFAAHGYSSVSVRDIANAARANSALVVYYFGGKEGLLSEVYRRHCAPMNRERVRLLNESQSESEPLSLEKVLEAFIRPSLLRTQDRNSGVYFTRLRAVLSGENSALLEKLVAENFDESTRIFVDALCTTLPNLTRDDVLWRFHFLLGAIYYTATGPMRIYTFSQGRCNPLDVEATVPQMVAFAAAGFRGESADHARPARRSRRADLPARVRAASKSATNPKVRGVA